jgi:predicted DNA-binding protein (UPF0251 family)
LARPPIERAVGGLPHATLFKPAGVPGRELEQIPLRVDELEAIRLVDLEGLSHEQAAAAMGVSRQTVGRVLEAGHAKVAEALVAGKAILIGGGQYRIEPRKLCCRSCGALWTSGDTDTPPAPCPTCGSPDVVTCWDPVGRCGAGAEGQGEGCGSRGRGGQAQGAGRAGGGRGSGRGGQGRGSGAGRRQGRGGPGGG